MRFMDNESHEPNASEPAQGVLAAENPPNPLLTTSENPLDVLTDFEEAEEPERGLNTRHDGWTGQRMAMFCAVLAETGIVTDACIAVGMSTTSAYSARRRSPLFAAAWEESLKLARDRLADARLCWLRKGPLGRRGLQARVHGGRKRGAQGRP